MDNVPGLVATMGAMGGVEFLNRQTLDYFGKTSEELKNWALIDAVHPDDLPRVIEARKKSIETGQNYEIEHRCRRADGIYRWFQVRGLPVRDTQNHITAWYLLLTDIDDRKKAEEALQSSERSLNLIINVIPTFIGVLRADGSLLYTNQAVLDYTGLTLEDVRNEDHRARFFHPEDVERLREERRVALARAVPFENEQRMLSKDGSYRWFLIRYKPLLDDQGIINRWYVAAFDIEDRKKAEEALQSSERNLSLMISAIPTYIHVLRTDGSVLYVNQAVMDYFGITLDDAKKEDYRARFFHPEDVERLRDERHEALTRPVPFENEQRVLGKDGKYRWFLIRYNPLLDERGRIDRWYAAATDIDDRKKAEEALQSSERNLSLMINVIPTFIGVLNTDGVVIYVNQTALDYTGITVDDVERGEFRSRIHHPEDIERLREERREALARPIPFENEQRMRGKDGEYRWFLFRYNPLLDKQGRIERWYVAAFDIEGRKRAEAQVEQAYLRLAEAQRLSKTGSFITDLVADELNFSDEAFRIFEFDPTAKVNVQMVRDRIHPEDKPTFDAVIARAMTGTDVEFGFRIVTSRGTVKHLRGMARVIGQSAGHPLFIGALQDVTEGKLAEEALNRARSELAHVARVTTLNALTASIAHEVNQPLSGIVSNASASLRFLSGGAPNLEEAREAVRDIIRDGKRAAEIITRIRALTKRTPMSREKLDLNETISEVLALLGDEAKRQSVIVRTQFADSLPPVAGDRVQLQQVVMNLVMNAIEAMSNVRERLRELVIITQNTDADCVQATVEDSGNGIASDTVDKIFDSFYTTKPGGMGMGLSISRSILQYHGGRLWAVVKDEAGTMFHFTVPKYREEGAYAPVTPS